MSREALGGANHPYDSLLLKTKGQLTVPATAEEAARVMELYDISTPKMQRGLCAALLQRVVSAETILRPLGISTLGIDVSILKEESTQFSKTITIRIGTKEWIICSSNALHVQELR